MHFMPSKPSYSAGKLLSLQLNGCNLDIYLLLQWNKCTHLERCWDRVLVGRRECISICFMNILFMCNYATCAQLHCSLNGIWCSEHSGLQFSTGALSVGSLLYKGAQKSIPHYIVHEYLKKKKQQQQQQNFNSEKKICLKACILKLSWKMFCKREKELLWLQYALENRFFSGNLAIYLSSKVTSKE